jgi:hypothetical protein
MSGSPEPGSPEPGSPEPGSPEPGSPEIRKLAHALGVEPARLAALRDVPSADVRALRKQIAHALFEADRARFAKVAALAGLVPVAVSARLTEHVLPPVLAARTAELIEPDRAVELVARLSDGYLADVSAAMDPSRAPGLIAQIPAERIARVAAELASRHEWVAIGGFVAVVSQDGLAASVRAFTGEQLLRIAYVIEDKERLDEVAGLVTDEQIAGMLDAARQHELYLELDDLLAYLGPGRRERIATRLAAEGDGLGSLR